MARIIEYNENDYNSSGYGGGGVMAVIVVLFILYMTGYLPGFTNTFTSFGQSSYSAPVDNRVVFPAGNISYVTAESLNMRQAPGNSSPIMYILPRGTKVTLLGESYQEPDGDIWLQVRVETLEGMQIGWVSRRYIS